MRASEHTPSAFTSLLNTQFHPRVSGSRHTASVGQLQIRLKINLPVLETTDIYHEALIRNALFDRFTSKVGGGVLMANPPPSSHLLGSFFSA